MLNRHGRHSRGQSLNEYAVMLVAVIIVIIAAAGVMSGAVSSLYLSAIGGEVSASPTPDPYGGVGDGTGGGGSGGGVPDPCPLVAAFTTSETGHSGKYDFADASSGGATTFAWDFGDGNTGSGASVEHDYPHTNMIYTVTLQVGNGSCVASTTQQVDVRPGTPPDPTPSPSPATTPAPTPTPTPTPTPSPSCVSVPNLVGLDPSAADSAIAGLGLTPSGAGDLATGQKSKVASQSPSSGSCVDSGSTVSYHYRPPYK